MHSDRLPISVLPEALFIHAANTPDKLAFHARGESATWRDLLDRALRAAAALTRHGVAHGDRCALILPSSLEFISALFGAQLVGAVPVALRPKQPAAQLHRRLREIAPRVVVTGEPPVAADAAAGVNAADLPPFIAPAALREHGTLAKRDVRLPSPGDLSHLQITSGTTGEARAAMLTHGNVAAAVAAAHEVLEPRADDVFVGWVPLYHDLGLVRFVFEAVYFGCTTHLIEPSMPTLPTWIETISAVGGTITAAPDFAYRLAARLVDPARVNLGTLRIATSGGEVVRLSTIRQFESRFNCPGVIRPGYGMAETTLGVSTLRTAEPLLVDLSGAVSNGRPLRALEVRILDASGNPCPPGDSGRIVVKGPTVFAGYLNDPASTSAVLNDGWLETGDDGAVDEEGYLYIHGRRRAMIKRAGASIAPREIEEIVDELRGVRRSAAIGVDARADSVTEDVVVIAEVERGVAAAQRADLREAIAGAVREAIGARPHEVLLVAPNAIPRTASGKIRYGVLKEEWALLRDQPLARG